MNPLLEIRALKTVFHTADGALPAVNDVSFVIQSGEILGVVGESGCGKTVTSLSILRLIGPPGEIVSGEILFQGTDLLQQTEKQMQQIRGNRIAMIFQEPMTSLNPIMTIGGQVAESLALHKGLSRSECRREAARLLKAVSIPDPETRVREYPHQLSGGMRQRVMIAIAIACNPLLLIADEPTTALDVTIQAQILDQLNSLRADYGLSILLITHALGVVAEVADRVIVMYAGRIVEEAPVRELFANPRHPYTRGLLDSIPEISGERRVRLRTIEGSVPDLAHLPKGCAFYDRCSLRMPQCALEAPPSIQVQSDHRAVCFAAAAV